jgi:hypothetical protein
MGTSELHPHFVVVNLCYFLLCLFSSKMTTFRAEGKARTIVLADKFGISHVIEKCLCAMFDFHLGTMHVSKDDAMMLTTMLLNLYIMFQSLVTLV